MPVSGQNGRMVSGRGLRLVLAAVLVLGLAGAGVWRRSEIEADVHTARETRVRLRAILATTRRDITDALVMITRVEHGNSSLRTEVTGLRHAAEDLAARIHAVRRQRDDAALAAWVTGGRIHLLRTCLTGVNRALNQLSVSDPKAVASLEAVRSDCEAVGT
jgi:hypothetical protein